MLAGSRLRSALCAFSLCALSASAQQPTAQQQTQPQIQSPIQLNVVVTGRSGKPTPELRQQDFTLLDNKTPKSITSFRALEGADTPTEVILVIDAVNTSYELIGYERGEIMKYLKANGGHLAYPTTLAIFTDNGTQIQDGFSKDGNAISQSLDRYEIGLRTIRRSQGFYGAGDRLQLSLTSIQRLAAREATVPGRKLVLWVSPGWPLLSGPGVLLDARQQRQVFGQIINMSDQLRRSRMTLYSLDAVGASESVLRTNYYQTFVKGVSKPDQTQIGDLALQVLAVQSGGLALNTNGLAEALRQCTEDASAYYQITFDPARAEKPDEYHSIQVRVDQPGLVARTRQGYYSQP